MDKVEAEFTNHLLKHPEQTIDSAAVVADVEAFFARYVILPAGLPLLLALWTAGTHIFGLFDAYPYLAITSPTKRCGKTRLSEVLALLCANALRGANLSEAVLFRLIEKLSPTLIIDEAEVLRDRKSERAQAIYGLLNAGWRDGAPAYRCEGFGHDVKAFSVYCPKVVITIGDLPDTLRDRCILVQMERRMPTERVGRFLFKRVSQPATELRERLGKTVALHQGAIMQVYEECDWDFLEDREAENWTPLLSVCSVLAQGRLPELKTVASALAAGKAAIDADDSMRMRLLADLRKIFADDQPSGLFGEKETAISSEALVTRLRGNPEAPWAEHDLNQRKLARVLKPFGVHPRQVWVAGRNMRGYLIDDLKGIVTRYLNA